MHQAKQKYSMELSECLAIGDRWSELTAGFSTGSSAISVLTGRGKKTFNEYMHKIEGYEIAFIAHDLKEAIEWILS